MNLTQRTSASASAAILVLSLGALGTPAFAGGPSNSTPSSASSNVGLASEFDAPMFDTTASLTGNRLPTYTDINCSDSACSIGIMPNPSDGEIVFITKDYAQGGSFSNNPGFIAKLDQLWENAATAGTSDYTELAYNLAQFSPGTDLAAAIADNAQSLSAPLSDPVMVGDINTWTAQISVSGASIKLAYAARANSIVRSICILNGTDVNSTSCQLDNLVASTVSVLTSPAGTTLKGSKSIAGLIPVTPQSLEPMVINVGPTVMTWANTLPGPALQKSLTANKNSVSMAYKIPKSPKLSLTLTVAALTKSAPARIFVKDVCASTTTTTSTCTRSRVSGPAYGFIGEWSQSTDNTSSAQVVSQFVGGKRLANVNCFPIGTSADVPMTDAQIRTCIKAINALASAVAGS